MKDAIRLERRIELAFEGHRFFDVRRWMIAEDTENMQMHGFEITKTITEKVRWFRSVNILSVKRCTSFLFPIKK